LPVFLSFLFFLFFQDRIKFVVENGNTFYLEEGEKYLFGDFGLKLRGELQCDRFEKHGFWVASCTTRIMGKNKTRLDFASLCMSQICIL